MPEVNRNGTILDAIVQRSSIRRTLMVIMALAMLPLLVLAAWQGVARFERERQITQVRLGDRAGIIAASRLNPLRSTASLLELLVADERVRLAVHPECAIALSTMSAAFPHVTNVVVATPDGAIACFGGEAAADMGRTLGPAVPLALPGEPRVRVSMPPPDMSLAKGTLLMTLRLEDGTRVAALLNPAWLEALSGTLDGKLRYAVSLTDGTGRVLASSRPQDWDTIGPLDVAGRVGMADTSGRLWLHGSATLFAGRTPEETVQLVLSQPEWEPFDAAWLFNVSHVLLPLFALLLAWFAIWVGADRSILRWVRDIGAVADEIGRGERVPSDDRFLHAPSEIRGLAAQLKRVARIIADRDQNLRRAAEQQRLSALELNHRVRNNLQIIGSWLAVEQARLCEENAGDAMGRVAVRVAAISQVHRLLYDGSELSLPGPSSLTGPLCRLLEQHGIGSPLKCEAGTVAEPVGIDTAVQISLWLVECGLALLPEAAARPLAVRLTADEENVRLELLRSDLASHDLVASTVPLVMQSMARQMGGTTDTRAQQHAPAIPVAFGLTIPRWRLAGSHDFSAK